MGKVAHPFSRSDKGTLSPDKTTSILDDGVAKNTDQLPESAPLGILLGIVRIQKTGSRSRSMTIIKTGTWSQELS